MDKQIILLSLDYKFVASTCILLNKYKNAELIFSSSKKLDLSLNKLNCKNSTIHIIGIGIDCNADMILDNLKRLRKKNIIKWYSNHNFFANIEDKLLKIIELIIDQKSELPNIIANYNSIIPRDNLIKKSENSNITWKWDNDIFNELFDYARFRYFNMNDFDYCNTIIKKIAFNKIDKYDKNELKKIRKYSDRYLLGNSQIIKELKNKIKIIGHDNLSNVHIIGETGTGKELVARLIHANSNRRDNNFKAINCATLSGDLIGSTLFGHVKGAFTNAHKDNQGAFEYADKGTLFLDEIGELNLEAQAKLLRVIQEKKISRIGSMDDKEVDVRIISATNSNLQDMIKNKRFREDLYYRISTFIITTPPLREHLEDLKDLTDAIIHKIAQDRSKDYDRLSKKQLEQLKKYSWHGNVRELENALYNAYILTENKIKDYDFNEYINSSLEKNVVSPTSNIDSFNFSLNELKSLEEIKKEYINYIYNHIANKNKEKTARLLKIAINTARKYIDE